MELRPFIKTDFNRMVIQPDQIVERALMTDDILEHLEKSDSYTFVSGDEILGCFGLHLLWSERAIVWSYLSADLGSRFIAVHKAVNGLLDNYGITRYEATVKEGFSQGERWVELLGFECEGLMKKYGPDGSNHKLYARVK